MNRTARSRVELLSKDEEALFFYQNDFLNELK